MEVILLERVEKLGQIGDVVTVKNGFARNFLLPRGKALRSNAANLKIFEANKAKIVADNEAKRGEADGADVRKGYGRLHRGFRSERRAGRDRRRRTRSGTCRRGSSFCGGRVFGRRLIISRQK